MPKYSESMGETLQRLKGRQAASEAYKRRRADREAQQKLSSSYARGYDPHAVVMVNEDRAAHILPPAEALADRDRRMALEHASLTAALLGDPLPGRSALDRRRGA